MIIFYANVGVMRLRLHILSGDFCSHRNRRVIKNLSSVSGLHESDHCLFCAKNAQNHLSRQCYHKAWQSSDSNKTLLTVRQSSAQEQRLQRSSLRICSEWEWVTIKQKGWSYENTKHVATYPDYSKHPPASMHTYNLVAMVNVRVRS